MISSNRFTRPEADLAASLARLGERPVQWYRHLTVGLARAESDAELIRYAALVARLGTASEVRFVHVLPCGRSSAALPDHNRALAEIRASVATHFTGVPPTTKVSCDVLAGPLTDCLLAYVAQQQIDLLLVGQRPSQARRHTLARRLAMKAPCSVWLVPAGSEATLRRLLVPIDFSEHAADTLRVAVTMARLSGGAECLTLHVYFNEAVISYEDYDQVLRGEEAEAYRNFIAPIDCQGAQVTLLLEEGANVALTIGRVADREAADLIVMGTRGRSRSAAILLGSVTEEAITRARVPILAVKHFGARLSVLQALLDRRFLRGGGLHTE